MREQPAPRASDSCSLPTKLANIHPVLFSSSQGPSFGIGKSTSPVELTARVLAAPREAMTPAAGGVGSVQPGSSRRPVRGAVTPQDPLAIWHFRLCFSVSPRKSRASWWLCGWVATASLPSSSTWSPGSLTSRGPQSECPWRSS